MACGAHLQLGSLELGEELCSLARMGQKKMISCYKLAGADLNTGDFLQQAWNLGNKSERQSKQT